jgi:ABC-2 type transport system permease protein
MPIINPQLAPSVPKTPPGGMFGGQMPEQKGDLHPLMDLLGVDWPDDLIVWDVYNPHPQLNIDDREIVFVGAGSGAAEAFNPKSPISAGLQEVVTMFPGLLRPKGSPALKFLPLMETSPDGGTIAFDQVVRPGMFGMGQTINRNRIYLPSGESYTLAARIKGPAPAEPEKVDAKNKEGEKEPAKDVELHAIVIADLDLISDSFFELRKRPAENMDFLDFDNVTFVLNCVDTLAGDDAFVSLRKRRPRHRTLEAVERESRKFVQQSESDEKAAEAEAKDQLAQAQKRLDEKVEELRNRKDLDKRTKQIMLDDLERVENRRLDVAKANIEDQKRRKILESKAEKEESIRRIQNRIRLTALLLPPLPALILGGLVFGVRLRRENRGASPNRLV